MGKQRQLKPEAGDVLQHVGVMVMMVGMLIMTIQSTALFGGQATHETTQGRWFPYLLTAAVFFGWLNGAGEAQEAVALGVRPWYFAVFVTQLAVGVAVVVCAVRLRCAGAWREELGAVGAMAAFGIVDAVAFLWSYFRYIDDTEVGSSTFHIGKRNERS